jgi:hypothetical protein
MTMTTTTTTRTPLAGHATVIEPTADPAEALVRAGLDWSVSRRPLWYTGSGNGSKPVKVPGRFAIVRDDTGDCLGTTTGAYHPLQNVDAFRWAAGLGEFAFGGATRDGAQTYLGVKLDEKFQMAGDEVGPRDHHPHPRVLLQSNAPGQEHGARGLDVTPHGRPRRPDGPRRASRRRPLGA